MKTAILLYILELISPNPRHPMLHDTAAREELAEEIEAASEAEQIPPRLLTYWVFCESTFRKKASYKEKSGAVSRGYGQTHGVAARLCRKAGHDPSSVRCSAYLMRYGWELCGRLECSLWWYASGRWEGTPRSRRIVKERMRKAGVE